MLREHGPCSEKRGKKAARSTDSELAQTLGESAAYTTRLRIRVALPRSRCALLSVRDRTCPVGYNAVIIAVPAVNPWVENKAAEVANTAGWLLPNTQVHGMDQPAQNVIQVLTPCVLRI